MWTSLVGFMGSGKSTVARLLCQATGRPLAVSDELVVTAAGRPIDAIFTGSGETAFRAFEQDVMAGLDPERNLVVDTGGGVVESPQLVELLRARGVVIWLDAPWTVLRERLRTDDATGSRPLVKDLGWAGLEQLHRRRRRFYAAAADFRLRAGEAAASDLSRTASLRSLLWERRRDARSR